MAEDDDDGTTKKHDSLSEGHSVVAEGEGWLLSLAEVTGSQDMYRGATCSGLDSHPRGTMEEEDRGEVEGRKCLQRVAAAGREGQTE